MKKTLKMAAVLAVVATLFSGCITATIIYAKQVSDEKKEITGDKVFEIEKGTITYKDGTVLSFKENGKYIEIDEPDGDFFIITPDYAYEGNALIKKYRQQENTDGTFYYSDRSLVFPVKWFRWERFRDDIVNDVNGSEGSIHIAGKQCISFTNDNMEVAGYNRIYMYKREGARILFEAIDVNSACLVDFQVPADWEKESGRIEFNESF